MGRARMRGRAGRAKRGGGLARTHAKQTQQGSSAHASGLVCPLVSTTHLLVGPKTKVEQQLVEAPLQEGQVRHATRDALGDLVHAPARVRVHGRRQVVEVVLVRGQRARRVHVPLAHVQDELPLGELGVHDGGGQHLKARVPACEPGVLELIGHLQHLIGVEVAGPVRVAVAPALRWRRRERGVAVERQPHAVVVELLGPQQPGEGLALDGAVLGGQVRRLDGCMRVKKEGGGGLTCAVLACDRAQLQSARKAARFPP